MSTRHYYYTKFVKPTGCGGSSDRPPVIVRNTNLTASDDDSSATSDRGLARRVGLSWRRSAHRRVGSSERGSCWSIFPTRQRTRSARLWAWLIRPLNGALNCALRLGAMAALDDSPRPGKAPEIAADATAWLVSLACQKAKDPGYRRTRALDDAAAGRCARARRRASVPWPMLCKAQCKIYPKWQRYCA
jgi:hypothetical protein